MATTTHSPHRGVRLALDDILVGDNVRDLDWEHVENLMQSIALRGLLVPLIVRPPTAGTSSSPARTADVVRVATRRQGGRAIGQALREPGRTARRGPRLAPSCCQRHCMVIALARPSAAF